MNPRADDILEWLEREMGYQSAPSAEAVIKICRGNMLPIWKFLLERVKSEKTVEKIRRNLHVHGSNIGPFLLVTNITNAEKDRSKDNELSKMERSSNGEEESSNKHVERGRKRLDGKSKASGNFRSAKINKEVREKEEVNERESESGQSKERALQEREAAEKEVARLRLMLQRLVQDMKGRMSDLSMEEGERQRVLDEKSNFRHRQVVLEAYDQRCEQAVRILSEYWRRLHSVVEHARESQRGKTGWSEATHDSLRSSRREPSVPATAVKGTRWADDHIFEGSSEERSIRIVCELISAELIENIRNVFLAYDGDAPSGETHSRNTKLGFEVDGGEAIPEQVRETALTLLRNPPQLLQAMITYTSRVVAMITRETEKIDIRADAEHLRFDSHRMMEEFSSVKEKKLPPSASKVEEKSKAGLELTSGGINRQLRERQTAHVQQFMATEEMLNHAAEAKRSIDELLRQIHGVSNSEDVSLSMNGNDQLQYGGLREIELEVWTKERELAGLKSSVDKLESEVQRLKMMSEERKQAKEDLRQKWRKIEEFNSRRMELESVYTALIHANMAAAASWEQHLVAAQEHSTNTILPVCAMVQNQVTDASDLLEREVTSFQRTPDNRLNLFPAFPQGLLDATGVSNSAGPETVAAAQRNADLLAARAGARDPSAISSINRINAALRNLSGEGSDAGLVAVVESLQFLFRHKVSAANLLGDLTRAVNHMQLIRDLVISGRMLLATANSSRPEYERCKFMYEGRTTLTAEWQVLDTKPRVAEGCAATAAEQEKIALEQWLPELKAATQDAQRCLEDSKRVRGLVDEWWEQPASTAVDWITVDGQNVAAWLSHVKQLQVAFYEKQLL